MTAVHFILPNDIDDPEFPSGGNVYDRRVSHGLTAAGWPVTEHPVHGQWPRPSEGERAEFASVLGAVPQGSTVLLDGLVACAAPEVLEPQAKRLRLVVLVHMPLAGLSEGFLLSERRALSAAAAVVTTSSWSRRRLLELYPLAGDSVHVVTPGVDPAAVVPSSAQGSRLLCVAAVAAHKGHDVLVRALAGVADLVWSCVCVGTLRREPGFVDEVRKLARVSGIADRVHFAGPSSRSGLDVRFAQADLFVSASRGETYGMAVTEALARGIPVLATQVGGLPEALGRAPDGSLPGLLVPAGDPEVFASALRRWLKGEKLRGELRQSARDRRATLEGWEVTTRRLADVLSGVASTVKKIYPPSVEDFADTP